MPSKITRLSNWRPRVPALTFALTKLPQNRKKSNDKHVFRRLGKLRLVATGSKWFQPPATDDDLLIAGWKLK